MTPTDHLDRGDEPASSRVIQNAGTAIQINLYPYLFIKYLIFPATFLAIFGAGCAGFAIARITEVVLTLSLQISVSYSCDKSGAQVGTFTVSGK